MRETIVVGMLGCGTVGGGVIRLLQDNAPEVRERLGRSLTVKRIAVKDAAKPRGVKLPAGTLTGDPAAVVSDPEIDVVVELIGGLEPTRRLVLQAIGAGKHVVTANKALLAAHGPELYAAARKKGVTIAFEGSVGGGIPVIRAIRESLTANRFRRIFGIVNGTSNYILTEMTERGASFAATLQGAQALGYAEADPSLDVGGGDAAHKMAVLAACAWDVAVDPARIPTEGIAELEPVDVENARALGFTIKSLGIASIVDGGLHLRVQPTFVPVGHVLAGVRGPFNAIYISGEPVGPLLLYGRGAGAGPTASAVVGDLLEVGRDLVSGGVARVPLPSTHGGVPLADPQTFVSSFYLRVTAFDRPGVLAKVAGALGGQGISIANVSQKEHGAGKAVPILVLTKPCEERAIRAAVKEIDAQPSVAAARTRVLHVETFDDEAAA